MKGGDTFMKHKNPLAMAWAGMAAALVWSPALPAQAAETDEFLVAIFACNSQGEAFAVANGFMLDIGGSTVVFSFGMDSWEDAATCVAIDTSGNSFELILSGLWVICPVSRKHLQYIQETLGSETLGFP